MLVLIIILAPITSYAKSYVADDNYIMSSNIHDLFDNYFGSSKSYKYFPYKCYYGNYDRECYYGIDKDFNYLNVTYNCESSYGCSQVIDIGVDENFTVNGKNIYQKEVSADVSILYFLVFTGLIILFLELTKVVVRNGDYKDVY